MIIVWGSATITEDGFAEARQISLEHVARSRREAGCISHSVSVDAENDRRLTFFEEWEDLAVLHQHFKVAESIAFAARLTELASGEAEIRIFESSRVN